MYYKLLFLLANAEGKQIRLNKAGYLSDWNCDDEIVAHPSKQDVEHVSFMVEFFGRGWRKVLNGNVTLVERIKFAWM